MITSSHPSPIFPSVAAGPTSPVAPPEADTAGQKFQAKARKKERKHARLRFFFGWCEGCQFFGSAF